MLLVKGEESRGFDVFFGCLEEGKHVGKPSKEKKFRKNVFLWFEGCLGLFIAPPRFSRRRPFKDR